jgi:hypothetical protein
MRRMLDWGIEADRIQNNVLPSVDEVSGDGNSVAILNHASGQAKGSTRLCERFPSRCGELR